MSMRDYPNSGYVVEVAEFNKLFQGELLSAFEEILDENDVELLTQFLGDNLPPEFPHFVLFSLNDEDWADDLESGKIFAKFDEKDLYVKTPTEALLNLENLGIYPNHTLWTTWG